MTQDPVLFTTFEWVLMAMAGLFALLVLAYLRRDDPSYPFADRDAGMENDDMPAHQRRHEGK